MKPRLNSSRDATFAPHHATLKCDIILKRDIVAIAESPDEALSPKPVKALSDRSIVFHSK
jgi:hypothetical protein